MKKTTTIVNFIPLSVLSSLSLHSDGFYNIVSSLKLNSSYNREETALFFVFRSILLKTVGLDPYNSMDFKTLEFFIESTLKELYIFKSEGFVNQQNMEINKIFCIFRSFYPETKDIFNSLNKPPISICFELEHFHNLVILTILYELEKTLKKMVCGLKTDVEKEEICFLKNERVSLQKTLSGGIRISLSKNRLVLLKRLYVGFDTEYRALDSKTNKLLCYTTATLSECMIKIRDDTVDFSVKDGMTFLPKTAPLIRTVVRLIRAERGKNDCELEELKERLIKKFEMKKLNNSDMLFMSKKPEFKDIQVNFVDLRQDQSLYSFKNLLRLSLERLSFNHTNFDCFKTYLLNLNPTIKQECILLAHFTTADVSSFEDFNEIKKSFTVLSKSFLTLDKALSFEKWKVFLRDTSLLSPTGMSLKSIGQLYSDLPLNKKELCPETIKNMDLFFEKNPLEFKEYAMQDAKIVLWHGLTVQDSHYELTQKYSVPVTLSSLASSFLTTELVTRGDGLYHPRTQNGLISVKDLPKLMTPSGIELSSNLHEFIDYFLGSYHGGRNESYLYGIVKGEFYDYDLPGAYPTAMAMLDYPDWDSKKMIGLMSGEDFLLEEGINSIVRSYTALKIKFEFPSSVRFPNLPVRLDFSSIIFPLTGETFCTGHEFVLAMKLGCRIQILGGVKIPFVKRTKKPEKPKKVSGVQIVKREPLLEELQLKYQEQLKTIPETRKQGLSENYLFLKKQLEAPIIKQTEEEEEEYVTQFFSVVKRLLKERLKYPKGSYMNLLYKFIANAGIGQMARGLNQKKRYDTQTNSSKVMPSGELVSPLFAGWITGNIRSTLTEIMNGIPESEIISSTTDGFITTEKNMELIKPGTETLFSELYFETRKKLTGSGALLERKYYEPHGVISWRTRGQLGLSGGIKAMTGYQMHEPLEMTIDKVNKSIKGSKQITFLQKSLRSAKEIFLDGGHSTLKLSERSFNLRFDNRREITLEHNGYHQTKPYHHKNNSIQNRLVSSLGAGRYRVYSPISSSHCKGDAYLDLVRRMLVRLLRTDWKLLNEPGFSQLSRKEIQKIMQKIGLVCSLNFISKQKGLHVIFNSIPNTHKTEIVLEKFSVVFSNFNIKNLQR